MPTWTECLRSLLLAYLFLSITVPTLGFSSCSASRNARQEVQEREQPQHFVSNTVVSRRTVTVTVLSILPFLTIPQRCNAGFFGEGNRRDLALCLVNLLRVQYWAESESQDMNVNIDNDDRIRQLYLETRLGAKAAVTNKIGGGATNRVYTIGSLRFRETLDDLSWYASKNKNKQAVQLIADLAEALASLVEFDGLETTLDPSPRSSLMMSMYNSQKATFVRRMLAERIIPTSRLLFNEFDPDVRNLCLTYVQSTYPNELPKQIESPAEAGIAT